MVPGAGQDRRVRRAPFGAGGPGLMEGADDGRAVDLSTKFAAFSDHWRPKIAAQLNGQDVRLVKVRGVFPWHTHADAEEMFLVWRGTFQVEFRDRVETLGPGQFLVVP